MHRLMIAHIVQCMYSYTYMPASSPALAPDPRFPAILDNLAQDWSRSSSCACRVKGAERAQQSKRGGRRLACGRGRVGAGESGEGES